MKLTVSPTYKPLVQKPNFCAPVCLQMVLFRRGVWENQEDLAFDLGVRIKNENRHKYSRPFQAVEAAHPDLGLNLEEWESKRVKLVLERLGLCAEVFPLEKVRDIEKFIEENWKHDRDIMINFTFLPIDNRRIFHYVLIVGYDTETKNVVVCDPYPDNKSVWEMPLMTMQRSMSDEWDGRERGFVVFSKK
jgi:hypothetical protein